MLGPTAFADIAQYVNPAWTVLPVMALHPKLMTGSPTKLRVVRLPRWQLDGHRFDRVTGWDPQPGRSDRVFSAKIGGGGRCDSRAAVRFY